jgi:hypothetical protein
MDRNQFDALTRTIATAGSRRQMLKAIGGIAMAEVLSVFGRNSLARAAPPLQTVVLNSTGISTVLSFVQRDASYAALANFLNSQGFRQANSPGAVLIRSNQQGSKQVNLALSTPYSGAAGSGFTAQLVYTANLPENTRMSPEGPKLTDLANSTGRAAGAGMLYNNNPISTIRVGAGGSIEERPAALNGQELEAACKTCKDFCDLAGNATFAIPELCGRASLSLCRVSIPTGLEGLGACIIIADILCNAVGFACSFPEQACASFCSSNPIGQRCPGELQPCGDVCLSSSCPCNNPGSTNIQMCPTSNAAGTICTDTLRDPQNCGQCGHDCSKLPHVTAAVCVDGRCQVSCESGYTPVNGECVQSGGGGQLCGGATCTTGNCCRGTLGENCLPADWECCSNGGGCPSSSTRCCTVNGVIGCCLK